MQSQDCMLMKKFIKDFRDFAFKGNMLDLAVGIIIGSAFTALVNSVVKNLMMPIISVFTGGIDFSNKYLPLTEASRKAFEQGADLVTAQKAGAVFAYGAFFTELLQFIIMALVVFILIKQITRFLAPAKEAPVTTKECPFCCTQIPLNATKCPHCTSDLEA